MTGERKNTMSKKPNIIFILADDQGAWSLGSAGNDEIITPNLDFMADNGMRFENFYCASPVCSPARASILTGMMPSGHGVQDWLRAGNVDREKMKGHPLQALYEEDDKPVDYLEDFKTYTDALAAGGYTCALSGKWHLGDSIRPKHGFSRWYSIGRGGCEYFHPDVVENGTIELKDEYITHLITDKAVEFIGELAEEENPFYLSVHYTAPHSPWDANNHPKEYLDLYKDCDFHSCPIEPLNPNQINSSPYADCEEKRRENIRGYYAAITALDEGVGKILKKLEETGAAEDTLVIFTADNGVSMGHHGCWGKGNATFPQNMFETSVKIPFIAYRKGFSPAVSIPQGLYSHYDLYATLLEYAGITAAPNEKSPGQSFCGLLQGQPEESGRDSIFVLDEYGPVRMLRTREYKYIHRYPYGPCELYHLTEDPDEKHNRYEDPAMAEVVRSMQLQLSEEFNKYTLPYNDGSKLPVYGKGQMHKLDGRLDDAFAKDFFFVNPKHR